MTALLRAALAMMAVLLAWPHAAIAHEVKPALLELTETEPGEHDVLWKQPVTDGRRLRLTPVLPSQCRKTGETSTEYDAQYALERWHVQCDLKSGEIRIDGLDRSLTDVFARLVDHKGDTRARLIRPDAQAWQLDEPESESASTASYLRIGIDHMIFGPDHLLFVAGLTLLVAVRRLLWVITSFTLAHSITLALTALGWVRIPGEPVEVLIAISIVLLAVEVVRKKRGQPSLAARKPWLIAFVIGLVHGLGFAGALAEIGLPKGEELFALLLFNVGLEIGQVMFVALFLTILWLIGRIGIRHRNRLEWVAIYVIGAIGSYWSIERIIG
ncbi:MAG: HupE/UreJ family protein [Blastomonas sp.]